jgi:hypothetical protein
MKETMYLAEKIQEVDREMSQTYSAKARKNQSLRGFL